MGWVQQPPGEVNPQNQLNDQAADQNGQNAQGKFFKVDLINGLNIGQQSIVPYYSSAIHCFMCKEKLKVEKDRNQEATNVVQNTENNTSGGARGQNSNILGPSGLSGILDQNCDENCYFIEAKRIRVSIKNKDSGVIEKKEVTVHLECLKQLEQLK